MASDKLFFYPLFFTYHDCWNFRTWRELGASGGWAWVVDGSYQHRGHVHFFLSGFPGGQKAYHGEQVYNFELKDSWSPRSDDPNQTRNLKIIGTPKWQFYAVEYWRRIYIQDWDKAGNPNTPFITDKKGIKWDASHRFHTFGPFREGKDNFSYWNNMPRTLPVEYWRDENMHVRDHFIRDEQGKGQTWNATPEGCDTDSEFLIPRSFICGAPDNHPDGDPLDNMGRRFGLSDSKYIFPTMEYQSVVHLNWQRAPGWESRPDGDGFSTSVVFPFKNESGIIQSPFSDDDGVVQPPGTYCHGFTGKHPEKVLKYAPTNNIVQYPPNIAGEDNITYDPVEWEIPQHLLGQNIVFNVPSSMQGKEDGSWVEQCLGGIVKARAYVTVEDNFGGRSEVLVDGTQFMVQTNFEGADQNEPAG